MTQTLKAEIPTLQHAFWFTDDVQDILKDALICPTKAGENDPVALIIKVEASRHDLSNEPIIEVLLGSSKRQRIMEYLDHRQQLALASLAVHSDACLGALSNSASKMRDTYSMEEDQVADFDVFLFPRTAIALGHEEEVWHMHWDTAEAADLISGYLPACVLTLLPPKASNHNAIYIEQELKAAMRILAEDIRQATYASPYPFELSAPRITPS